MRAALPIVITNALYQDANMHSVILKEHMVLKLFPKSQMEFSLFLLLQHKKYINKTSSLPLIIQQYHRFRNTP